MGYWIKLGAVCLGLFAAALAGWAVFLPASHPALERAGLLQPMRALGLPIAETAGPAGGRPGGGFGGGGGGIAVIAQEVGIEDFDRRLVAIGTSRAERSVVLTSEVSGTVVEVNVASGDWVEAGTVVLRLNSEAQELARARAELALSDAQVRAARVAQLQSSGSATQVQIDDAELALSRANLDLRDTEFELQRREIEAPISGWVGLVDLEIGKQITSSTEIARLDDRSKLRIDFEVPERFVGLINPGDSVEANPLSRPQDVLQGTILATDARVDQGNRALSVQAQIANDGDRLRPGMAFRVALRLPGESLPMVDPIALQWDREGAFVWAMDDENTVRRARVEVVQRRDSALLVRGELAEGQLIVVEGVQNLRPGATVAPREMRRSDGTLLEQAETAQATAPSPEI